MTCCFIDSYRRGEFQPPSVCLRAIWGISFFVIGDTIGYAIVEVLFRRRNDDREPSILVVALMLAAAFAARFLLFDEMGLAKMLFGF